KRLLDKVPNSRLITKTEHTPSFADQLARYHNIDIALDTFPYNGTTVSCEAMWMGAPLVTLAGDVHIARVCLSLLTQLNLPELAATSEDEYVKIAADLVNDLPRLRELRRSMRDRMRTAPLLDHAGFTRELETALREAWRSWCAS